MAFTFKIYSDAALTTEPANLLAPSLEDGSTPAGDNDQIFYIGSIDDTVKAQAASDPGTDQITISIENAIDEWAAGVYVVDTILRPTVGEETGYKYKITVGGTAVTEPTWPTSIGADVSLDGVTYECIDDIHLLNEVTLALDAPGLGTGTPGDPLDIGTQITGGTGNGTPIHMRVNQGAHPKGTYTDLQLGVETLEETAI